MPAKPNDLAVGQRYRDNDPRMKDRVLTITGFCGDRQRLGRVKAICVDVTGKEGPIDISRFHVDGKSRRSGFSLVSTDQSKGA